MTPAKPQTGRGSFWISSDGEICVHRYSYSPGALYCLPHTHAEYNVAFCLNRRLEFLARGEEHVLEPGDVLVINPGDVHCGHYDSPPETTGLTIHLTPRALKTILQRMRFPGDLEQQDVLFLERVRDPSVLPLVEELAHEQQSRRRGFEMIMESLVVQIMVHLLRRSLEPDLGRLEALPRQLPGWQMVLALEYMNARGKSLFSLGELCAELGTSATRLIQLFKNSVGNFSPQAFYNRMIMHKAQELLRANDYPIKQIAFDLGFQNESHFCKLFRLFSGATPGQYRSAAASGEALGQ